MAARVRVKRGRTVMGHGHAEPARGQGQTIWQREDRQGQGKAGHSQDKAETSRACQSRNVYGRAGREKGECVICRTEQGKDKQNRELSFSNHRGQI